MKKNIKKLIQLFATNFIKFFSKMNAGRYFIDELSFSILNIKKTIKHNDLKFSFYIPNRLNFFRIDTFSSKEPETLSWIDSFKKIVYFGILALI